LRLFALGGNLRTVSGVIGVMQTTRREMTFVLGVALVGLTLVTLVAFAPWYDSLVLS
jgi:hypothetical protein